MNLIIKKIKNKKALLSATFWETQKSGAGFTIVELMVSIFIIIFISGIFLGGYQSSGRKARLKMTAQNLSSDIRKAQGFALGLKEFSDIGKTPSGGWGVYMSSVDGLNNYYDIYADHGDGAGGIEDHIYQEAFPPFNEKFERINLEGGVYIKEIIFYDSVDNPNVHTQAHITFEPPDPLIYFCDEMFFCDDYVLVDIILSDRSGEEKTVVVNKFGLVDVED